MSTNNHKLAETAVELAKIFRIFTVFACGIFLVITIFAYDILQLIMTPEYSSAASVVIYLTPAVVFSGMYIFAPGIAIKEDTCVPLAKFTGRCTQFHFELRVNS